MRKLMLLILLVFGTSAAAMAFQASTPTAQENEKHPKHAPEIDPATGIAALTLLAGAAMIIRGRRK